MDLFVCCHLQGDPSCTYLETLACGVPIAGYANEAMQAITRQSGSGWATAMGDVEALVEHAGRGLEFARDHCFEKTADARMEQLPRAARES